MGLVACGGDATMMPPGGGDVTMAKGMDYKFVASSLLVPQVKTDYAIDLNGDGKVDNQLGNIIGALASQNLDTQSGLDQAVGSGDAIILASIQSEDATLKGSSDAVGVKIYLGKAQPMPDYTGMGTFVIDPMQAAAQFYGKLAAGKFSSNNPVTTKAPVSITINLPLIAGAAPVPLRLNGAHIQFQSSNCKANPTTGKTPMMCGELHGSVRSMDIQTQIIPAVASLLSQRIMADPNSDSSKQIKNIFDVGDGMGGTCTNATDGTKGTPMDGKISVCEVAMNAIIGNILVPDIQVFSDDGSTYAPNSKNTKKDSLSMGIGFEIVGAKY
jgi:hypothetical protein